MKNIYESLYDKKNRVDLSQNLRIQIIYEILMSLNLKNKKILDIGCYDGTLLARLDKSNDRFGLDGNNWAVKEAKKRNINVKKFFFDQKPLPFKNNFFDAVICGEFIEHVYDTDLLFSQIYRILKKGGNLIISTPNLASLGRRILLALGNNPYIENSPDEKESVGHIRYFIFNNLVSALEKNHFKILKSQSDVINFSAKGEIRSTFLAKLFPRLGQSIICLAVKK